MHEGGPDHFSEQLGSGEGLDQETDRHQGAGMAAQKNRVLLEPLVPIPAPSQARLLAPCHPETLKTPFSLRAAQVGLLPRTLDWTVAQAQPGGQDGQEMSLTVLP